MASCTKAIGDHRGYTQMFGYTQAFGFPSGATHVFEYARAFGSPTGYVQAFGFPSAATHGCLDPQLRDVPCQTAMDRVGQWFGRAGPARPPTPHFY